MSAITSIPGSSLRLAGQCDLAAVREVSRQIRSFLENQGLSPSEIQSWELVCAEAGNNAVEHAPLSAHDQPIEFAVEVTPTMVELRVTDHTAGFSLPDQVELPDPLSEGGRGLFLIRSLTTTVEYLRGRGANCLIARRDRAIDGPNTEPPASTMRQAMLEATLHTMTEEMAASYEILSAIFRFTEELSRRGIDTEFLARWLRELKQITGADWYVMRLLNDTDGWLSVAHTSHPELNLPPLQLPSLHGDPPGSAELRAIHDRQDVWFDAITPLSPEDPLAGLGSPLAGLVHPLYVAGERVGVLAAGRYARSHAFTAAQVNIIHTLSDFFGIQIRNAQFHTARLQARLVERDYELAARIQRQLLPKQHFRNGPWGTLGVCESSQRVGGDFYDIFEVGSRGLFLAVADVMGKGLPAALVATVFRTLLRARPELAFSPGAFIEWLNHNLVTELGDLDMFITAQLAYVNLQTRELRVAGAGHPPLLVAGRDRDSLEVLSSGPPLGIASALEFQEERRILPPNARLLLYTDGVSEARGPDGNPIGTRTLLDILTSSAEQGQGLEETLRRFTALQGPVEAGSSTTDDRTLLLLLEEDETRP